MIMKEYNITIKLLSDTIVGSAEGFSTIVDTDVVFDDVGIPYIPAKRIKGIIRENTQEILNVINSDVNIDEIFGKEGETFEDTKFFISNLYIEDYEKNKNILTQFINEKNILTKDEVISSFTSIRSQTAIDEDTGVAKRNSLRISRVLKKGIEFTGSLIFNEKFEKELGLACLNTRRIGTMRNRGFGEVKVTIEPDIITNALETTKEIFKKKEGIL